MKREHLIKNSLFDWNTLMQPVLQQASGMVGRIFETFPERFKLPGEIFTDGGLVDDQDVLHVVGGGCSRPVVAACADGLPVKYCELVVHMLFVIIEEDRDTGLLEKVGIGAPVHAGFVVSDDAYFYPAGVGSCDLPGDGVVGNGEDTDVD